MDNWVARNIRRFINPAGNVNIVVLGHQKSGTTAIAVLLARVVGMDVSIDPLFHIDQGKGKAAKKLINNSKNISWLFLRHPNLFGRGIIKDPDLIFVYKPVRHHYCNAKFLFVVRDPRDTIRSICNRLGLVGDEIDHCPKVTDMKSGNKHWELILSGQLPKQDVRDLQSSFIYDLAHRWNMAAEIYLNNADEMVLFRYETFLREKEKSINKIATEIGFKCVKTITEYVDVQYQPKGDSKSDWTVFFGKKNLDTIEEICAKSMSAFGYDSSK
jgi:hypothetical protein